MNHSDCVRATMKSGSPGRKVHYKLDSDPACDTVACRWTKSQPWRLFLPVQGSYCDIPSQEHHHFTADIGPAGLCPVGHSISPHAGVRWHRN
jgi:hypothetical protein